MNSKKYVIGFIILVGLFFWGNVCLWYACTRESFVMPDGHGDLTRMAFMPNRMPAMRNYKPNKKHIEFRDYINMKDKPSVDIVTLGDSFSNGGAGAYYQDYIAEHYNKNILNLPVMEDGNPLTVLNRLIDTGILEEIRPKVVILESVERAAAKRLGMPLGSNASMTKDDFIKFFMPSTSNIKDKSEGVFPALMMSANKKMVNVKLKYNSNENQLSDEVYRATLIKNMFSDKSRENMLLYYCDDLWYKAADIDYSQLNNNLNIFADKLKVMGIHLIVMINVDKFDLYYPYIVDSAQNTENNFMEELAKQQKRYYYIDTKAILRNELAKGETDIYWQDDTHWSWKAQHKVADVIMDNIR